MSLVAYASSDDSEDETNEENLDSITVKASPLKKPRDTVKITIPSLKQFQDEEAKPEPVKKPQFKSGSGLFGILPAPKYTTSSVASTLTPHILKKNKSEKSVIKPPAKRAIDEIDDDEPGSGVNFFSLDNSKSTKDNLDYPSSSRLFSALPKPSAYHPEEDIISSTSTEKDMESSEDATGVETFDQSYEDEYSAQSCAAPEDHVKPQQGMFNDKEFLKMKGKRDGKEINFIDVNAADQLTGKDEWLMQSLTEEKVQRPSKRKNDMPTTQQRRKHQITYLAFQAKERELDLKNQWALNSRTRRETQAKYGF